MAKVRSVHPTSNNISNREPSQHPFGGCYNVIELTLSTHKDVKPIKYKYISFQSTEEMRPDIQSINNKLRYTFLYGKSRNIKWRKRKLDKLKYFLLENQKEIFDCMVADVGRFCSTYCTKYVWNLLKFIYVDPSLFASMATEILSRHRRWSGLCRKALTLMDEARFHCLPRSARTMPLWLCLRIARCLFNYQPF